MLAVMLATFMTLDIRGDALEYRLRRGEIWQTINQQRPGLPSAFTHEQIYQVRSRLPSPEHFEWCLDRCTDPLTDIESSQYRVIKNRVQQERTRLWLELQEPGTPNPPKGFTLFPNLL
jgi:hypothetical protein